MLDKDQIRDQQRRYLGSLANLSGMSVTAIAHAIKVAPSTLNKIMPEDKDVTHVLSTPTLDKLAAFEREVRAGARASARDGEIVADAVQKPENVKLLQVWERIDDDLKISILHILEAITASAPRKAS